MKEREEERDRDGVRERDGMRQRARAREGTERYRRERRREKLLVDMRVRAT